MNEWKLREMRDNCRVFTFLHETMHLQLVFEKANGISFFSCFLIQFKAVSNSCEYLVLMVAPQSVVFAQTLNNIKI